MRDLLSNPRRYYLGGRGGAGNILKYDYTTTTTTVDSKQPQAAAPLAPTPKPPKSKPRAHPTGRGGAGNYTHTTVTAAVPPPVARLSAVSRTTSRTSQPSPPLASRLSTSTTSSNTSASSASSTSSSPPRQATRALSWDIPPTTQHTNSRHHSHPQPHAPWRSSEPAMFAFDEELERARWLRDGQAPVFMVGRGGAGNAVHASSGSAAGLDGADAEARADVNCFA